MKSIFIILLLLVLVAPAMADNITIITPNPTSGIASAQTGYIPTPAPISTVTPTRAHGSERSRAQPELAQDAEKPGAIETGDPRPARDIALSQG